MKKHLGLGIYMVLGLLMIFGFYGNASAHVTFPSAISTDDGSGPVPADTNDTLIDTVQVNVPAAGNVLVLATFSVISAGSSGNPRTGEWWLEYSGTPSQPIQRYLTGTNDAGVVSVSNIFSGVSSGSQVFSLKAKSLTASEDVTTYKWSLVAVSLVGVGGTKTLANAQYSSAVAVAAGTTYDLVTGATISVPVLSNQATENNIYVAATFSSNSNSDTAVTGDWELQIANGGWQTIGTFAKRLIPAGSPDIGSNLLFGIAPDLGQGTYNIRLVHKKSDATPDLYTSRVTLSGVALNFANPGGGYLPYYQVTPTAVNVTITETTLTPGNPNDFSSVNVGTINPSASDIVAFICGHDHTSSTTNTDKVLLGAVGILQSNKSTEEYLGQNVERDLESEADFYSAGSLGLYQFGSAGTYYPQGFGAVSNETATSHSPNLCGFLLTSSTSTLVELVGFEAFPKPEGIALEWETAAEIDNAGFYLWRLELGEKDYKRITAVPIQALGGTTWGGKYSFIDYDVQVGNTYSYRLEDVDLMGVSAFHGPADATMGFVNVQNPGVEAEAPSFAAQNFVWDSQGFDRFRLQFSKSQAFDQNVLEIPNNDKGWIDGSNYTPTRQEWNQIRVQLSADGRIYWRVVGGNTYGHRCLSDVSWLTLTNRDSGTKVRIKK